MRHMSVCNRSGGGGGGGGGGVRCGVELGYCTDAHNLCDTITNHMHIGSCGRVMLSHLTRTKCSMASIMETPSSLSRTAMS